ncbi:hypothetical protein RQP53_19485 [Paucibacter sp. APW11]|uniref:Uncharacterized protein n=1 Tax=Roseateles aquae TaxID=3077235 RepID=A0ABU3PH75_9BURK|nr:hypothetical protein [Paucibacter sp. APW11]MDT9001468.1 hypothetical protein [Paucibacter sp. APW11]
MAQYPTELDDNSGPDDLGWMAPGYLATPAEALERIRQICAMHEELFGALFALMATHGSLPREILAAAIKQFRPDAQALSNEDLVGLLTATVNGGRQGFDAVMRTRRSTPRKAGAVPWAGS